ncbi:hypothetical protein RRSWK_05145 [Rhodopirellula sp. SWK7]|nr:hypothetical protein RRSWK_05145 [Rhodopirellula sp. SWK7]
MVSISELSFGAVLQPASKIKEIAKAVVGNLENKVSATMQREVEWNNFSVPRKPTPLQRHFAERSVG